MKKQWQLLNPDPQAVQRLSSQIGCSPLIARLLVIRGILAKDQASRFLNPSFNHLTSPLEMADMEVAVRRIHRALTANEKILVFGDYDADGITATAVIVSFLRQCGARVSYYIPHRITDGYGLRSEFITRRVLPAGAGLIITVDCGSSSQQAVRLARQAGIHTIVTDHHPVDSLPDDAIAVLNPTRKDCPSDLSHLAGVGVAFYLTIALRAHLREKGFWKKHRQPNLKQLCDLVAVGTVADVAPLIGENRSLTAAGLQQINQAARPGIAALMRMSGSPEASADAETIAFRLAPRLNAAGRLVHARMACELLLTDDPQKAKRLAKTLCRLNSRRQSMEKDLLDSIRSRLDQSPEHLNRPVLVVHGKGWHEGILGIVASRLTRQFHRPTVVISTRNGTGKGSARSVEGIDLTAALAQCEDLLDRFGGHPLAAGLSLQSTDIEAFRDRMETAVGGLVDDRDTEPALFIDAQLPLGDVTPSLMDSLDRLGPFGQCNAYPLFQATGIRVHECKAVGEQHRRMVLSSESGNDGHRHAIQFNIDSATLQADRFEKIAFRPQWNYWNGRKRLQLLIEDTAL